MFFVQFATKKKKNSSTVFKNQLNCTSPEFLNFLNCTKRNWGYLLITDRKKIKRKVGGLTFDWLSVIIGQSECLLCYLRFFTELPLSSSLYCVT